MLNRIILIGRLTADPELRYTPQGTAVVRFSLAVNRPFTNQQGKREADYIDIIVWRQLAEACAQYLRKGRLVAVEGRLQIRTYENQEGRRVRVAEVVAENVRFLESMRRDDEQSPQPSGTAETVATGEELGLGPGGVPLREEDIPF
jgi:single stranded DNA-binding protein (ssb)